MSRARRVVVTTALVVLVGLCGPASSAWADPYVSQLCMNNPAYRSMHEDQCPAAAGSDPNNKHPSGGLLGAIGHLLGGLL